MHPVLFTLGPVPIHSYRFFMAVGAVLGVLYAVRWRNRVVFRERDVWMLSFVCLLGGFIGSKLAIGWESWSIGNGFWRAALNWDAGNVFYGAVIGGASAAALFAWGEGLRVAAVLDLLAPLIAIVHGIARFGCFLAGCCHGRPTDVPWGVRFDAPGSAAARGLQGIAVHPTQLYESFGAVCIFLLLHIIWRRPGGRSGKYGSGEMFLAYVVLCGALRFGVEFFRGDERGHLLPGLSPSQWVAIASVVGAVIAYFLMSRSALVRETPLA